ncbi:MAG: hypothetical protein MJ232_00240 [archaeon]|nr:hypothetical protein [Bacilli bacterium]MCQ2976431.1 hypothetical protein [archaeon]
MSVSKAIKDLKEIDSKCIDEYRNAYNLYSLLRKQGLTKTVSYKDSITISNLN